MVKTTLQSPKTAAVSSGGAALVPPRALPLPAPAPPRTLPAPANACQLSEGQLVIVSALRDCLMQLPDMFIPIDELQVCALVWSCVCVCTCHWS